MPCGIERNVLAAKMGPNGWERSRRRIHVMPSEIATGQGGHLNRQNVSSIEEGNPNPSRIAHEVQQPVTPPPNIDLPKIRW